ncbi:MAG: DUF799 family lipoprotein [Proteobacteria bacterium]|nr:DUF799 family lipoprotein [Pseudomonadota bacterium]
MLIQRYLFPLLLLVAGCSGTYTSTLNFNPSEPIRIAVLPFAQLDSEGKLVQEEQDLLVDNVALISSKQSETPAQFMQSLIQSELASAALDVITPAVIEADLLHNGFEIQGTAPLKVDLAKVFAADPAELCGKLLSCDAVLYGKVTTWDRSYYGIQATATVGLNLKLVSARTGKILYEVQAQDSDSRGITKGPTGFSNLVLEPLKGLDNEIIQNVAREVADNAIKPLSNRNRPEFLKTAPPAIIASAHDARTGLIPSGGRLVVIAFGTPGQLGAFSIGSVALGIPLTERAPGHYIGEFVPLAIDSFKGQYVTISLTDQFGRSTSQKLAKTAVRY